MAYWSWQSRKRNGGIIDELSDLTNRQVTFTLNRPAVATAQLRLDSPQATPSLLTPGVHELSIFRDGNEVRERFWLASASVSGTTDDATLNLTWLGLAAYLQCMIVRRGATATSTNQTDIVWAWINAFQTRTNGDYGLTQGLTPTSDTTRSILIEQDTDIMQATVSIAELDTGFDFEVDNQRRFNCWKPERGTDKGLRLDSSTNVLTASFEQQAGPGAITNNIRVFGSPGTTVQAAENTDSMLTYGRREASLTHAGEFNYNALLLANATRIIAEQASTVITPNVLIDETHPTVAWGTYWLGDTAYLDIRAGEYVDIGEHFRISSIQVALDDDSNESIQLGMVRA